MLRTVTRAAAFGLLLLSIGALTACGDSKSPNTPTPQPPPPPPTQPVPPPAPEPPPPPPPPPPPTLTLTKWVAFGDSLTEGVVSPAPTILRWLVPSEAYPSKLQTMLAMRYTAQTPEVINRGVSGEFAEDGVRRFSDILRSDQPQAVLLLEGVNDIAAEGSSGVSIALSSLNTMMSTARNRGVVVFVATLPPQRAGTAKAVDQRLLDRFNDEVRRLARGENAEIVDIAREMDVSLIGADGLHPTEAGYVRMAELFFARIIATKEIPAAAASKPSILTQKAPPSANSGS